MDSKRIHGTSVALGENGLLILGVSGSGKSDLALRLIDSGATLISDDQTVCMKKANDVRLFSMEKIYGLIEIRGVGLMKVPYIENIKLSMIVELVDKEIDRFSTKKKKILLGLKFPLIKIFSKEASAVAKIKLKLYEEEYNYE